MTIRSWPRLVMLSGLALGLMGVSWAQEKSADDVAQLKAQVEQQQKQIEELTRRLDALSKPQEQGRSQAAATSTEGNAAGPRTLDPATRPLIASTTPIFPNTPAPTPISIAPPQAASSDTSSPLQF